MKNLRFKAVAVVVLAVLPLVAKAKIDWEASEIECEIPYGSEPVAVSFPFIVSGSKPIRIAKVESDCDCTVAQLKKRDFKPGEFGEISAIFTPGSRRGLHERNLRVAVDGESAEHKLTLRIKIADLVQVDKHYLVWSKEEIEMTKQLRLTITKDVSLQLKQLTEAQAENFDVRLVQTASGTSAVLEATPVRGINSRHIPVTINVFKEGVPKPPLTFVLRLTK